MCLCMHGSHSPRLLLICIAIAAALLFLTGSASAVTLDYADYFHWDEGVLLPGEPSDMVVSGDHVFVMSTFALWVIDISDPSDRHVVGELELDEYYGHLTVSGHHVYIKAEDNYVVDVSDPGNPLIVGSFASSGNGGDMAVSGDYLYLADWPHGLEIYDISTPVEPTNVASLPLTTPSVPPYTGFGLALSIQGDRLYCTAGSSGVHIIDIGTPSTPQVLGTVPVPTHAIAAAVTGDLLLVNDFDNQELQIHDVSDPTAPVPLSSLANGWGSGGVVVSGDKVWIRVESTLRVVDISEPETPAIISSARVPGYSLQFQDLVLSGDYLYTTGEDFGLHVFDISAPEAVPIMSEVQTLGDARAVAVFGAHAYVADSVTGLQVVDLADPENAEMAGSVSTPGSVCAVVASGTWAYLADEGSRLHVIDVSASAEPVIVGGVDIGGNGNYLAVSGDRVYVTSLQTGLTVVDVSTPTVPAILGSLQLPLQAHDVAVSGQYAYVAGSEGMSGGLYVVDVSEPGALAVLGSVDMVLPRNLTVSGDFVYVGTGLGELQVIDISMPDDPMMVGTLLMGNGIYDVSVSGTYVYVANGYAGLHVADVTDPMDPRPLGNIMLSDVAFGFNDPAVGVSVGDGVVVVACRGGGLRVCPLQSVEPMGLDDDPGGDANPLWLPGGLSVTPNPFNPRTTISFVLAHPGSAQVAVYDPQGRRVSLLADRRFAAGSHDVIWTGMDDHGRPSPSGVYLIRLETETERRTAKAMLVR